MLKRLGVAVLWAVVAYIIGAVAGGFLVMQFSGNMHDRSMEAGMTAMFFFGPAAAVLAFFVSLIRSLLARRAPGKTDTS